MGTQSGHERPYRDASGSLRGGAVRTQGRGNRAHLRPDSHWDFLNIDQNYGDNVTATTMGSFAYGGAQGFTPNITLTYGNSDPALWTTGYGNLSNILFEDTDFSGVLNLTFTAAAGYQVRLHTFDIAAYTSAFATDPTVNSIRVYDGANNVLFTQDAGTVSRTTNTFFSFGTPLQADVLRIEIYAINLGGLNDDIGIDNVTFSQVAIPEPASSIGLLGLAALAFGIRRRRAASR